MLSKVLGSAIANATENEKADADKLVVIGVSVDGGRSPSADAALDGSRQPHQQPHLATCDHGRRSTTKGLKERTGFMDKKRIPSDFRLGVIRGWSSSVLGKASRSGCMRHAPQAVRQAKLGHAGVSSVEVERADNKVKINIFKRAPAS